MVNTILQSFNLFFKNKGNVASIAEKASQNYEKKIKVKENIYYFAIGHIFKQLDKKQILKISIDENNGKIKYNRFNKLIKDTFNKEFTAKLNMLINDIRNLNSHYIHDFSKLNIQNPKNNFSSDIIDFITQAFELSVEQVYLYEKKIKYEHFENDINKDSKIVHFISEKFFPINNNKQNLTVEEKERFEDYKKMINDFNRKTKKSAIDNILFIDNPNDFSWGIYDHKVFDVPKGKYLSFYGSLFVLAMFLYKDEAIRLISKIKGFKRNDDTKYRSKIKMFTFYSKKFSSQDIDSEDSNLIKFRDIVGYLNHYPSQWNQTMESGNSNNEMTKTLKLKLIDLEIKQRFVNFNEEQKYIDLAKLYFFNKDKYKAAFSTLSQKEKENFLLEVEKTKEYKDALAKIHDINISTKYDPKKQQKLDKQQKTLEREKDNINTSTQKLIIRIAKNYFYKQYSRNNDKFIEFAIRFLAENKYFGSDAEFKMYKYYSSEQEDAGLEELKKTKSKKDYDKLKFHKGKLTHYCTFGQHLEKYPDWDTPFVIENNSVQLKIDVSNNNNKIVYLNRNLLIYFLEHALYGKTIEKQGKNLLIQYYNKYIDDFNAKRKLLEQNIHIDKDQKKDYKKLFPKRLVYKYSDKVTVKQKENPFNKILEDAEKAENRYNELLEKVKKEEIAYKNNFPKEEPDLVQNFIKRNKGKQFKFQFIRKACNLMYFRNLYFEQINTNGHHKRFNITKEEFNDFSKWMFAFGEVPIYKKFLAKLFEDKGFYKNTEFKYLFETSNTLEEMYEKTKSLYNEWLKNDDKKSIKGEDNFNLANYNELFDNDLFIINTSHFINFLETNKYISKDENSRYIYKSLENSKYLIPEFYYKEKLDKSEYKTFGKLYNTLKKIKLEDSLLYEIAMRYLNKDKNIIQNVKTNIVKIQNQNLSFNITDRQGQKLFTLILPFKQLMAYKEFNIQYSDRKRQDFWEKFDKYINQVKNEKDLKVIANNYSYNKELKYEELKKIHNHIITFSNKFTLVSMEIEKYFVSKNKLAIISGNHIKETDIRGLQDLIKSEDRNNAFHFDIPNDNYIEILKQLEKYFIRVEIKPLSPTNFETLGKTLQDVCLAFLETLHNEFYSKEKDYKKKIGEAKEKYFNALIIK